MNPQVFAEMDAVDPLAEAIRYRRAGRWHPPPPDFLRPHPSPVPRATELLEALAEFSEDFWDPLLPHAGDEAIEALGLALGAEGADPGQVLAHAREYDDRCARAEERGGSNVDAVDCIDVGNTLMAVCAELHPESRDLLAAWVLPGLSAQELPMWMDHLSDELAEVDSMKQEGVPSPALVSAIDEVAALAADIVWRSLCWSRHPDSGSSDEAVLVDARSGSSL